MATNPTTEEEKDQRSLAEEKRSKYKKSLNQWKKQRKIAEEEAIRNKIEKERVEKAEKRAADEKRRAEAKRVAEQKREERRIAEETRKAEENKVADEACSRLVVLPPELQVFFSEKKGHILLLLLMAPNICRSLSFTTCL